MREQIGLSRAERQRLQLQAEILEAAFLEFSERGYHQTAISDIAKRLGIGHGTFYRHFENKRDILQHVISDTMQKIMALLTGENAPQAVKNIEEYREQCQRISERLRAFAQENPLTLKLVLLEATSIDAEMTQFIQNLMHMAGMLTADYLEHGVEQGFFRENLDCENTGHNIIGMIMNGALRFLANPDDLIGLENYGNSIIDLIIGGVAKTS
ncbi:TetR/AcrR family transcriptional regulator [Acinetobacter bereziniae]|uniref:TetR/AcrR family transcriptional regulator n=1 Tax=Acinetobacter bereziniae TaxID=106648 RepID=UPI00124FA72E|nr:TetR/AcrR family transcriptional regulator [Acinetobacter bereziniae]MCU4433987.1 TetR/AcrR family transcriptional regulator [Acinetobacter bereziniae]MCV2442083.1 TetR/AcrR family transcriptional regulator [Acinetobacter bereziniae]